MRVVVAGLVAAGLVSAGVGGAVWMMSSASPPEKVQAAEKAPAPAAPAAPAAKLAAKADALADVTGTVPASEPKPAPVPAKRACANPNALGIGRVVEIDTTGGPGFGFEHFKQLDFLADKEVVLTFDDGPWPVNTPAVLKALAEECTTGIFFAVGKHATYHPDILRQVAAAGHTVGSHTWSHVNLNKKGMTEQQAKDEIEKGFSAVRLALGAAPAPFFRFPQLQHPPAMVTYLGTRDIAMFSTDLDLFDFKAGNARQDRGNRDDQGQQIGQGHHPDARFPEAHRRSAADAARPIEGGRLQGRADEGKGAAADHRVVRCGAGEGRQTADDQFAAGVERGADGGELRRSL